MQRLLRILGKLKPEQARAALPLAAEYDDDLGDALGEFVDLLDAVEADLLASDRKLVESKKQRQKIKRIFAAATAPLSTLGAGTEANRLILLLQVNRLLRVSTSSCPSGCTGIARAALKTAEPYSEEIQAAVADLASWAGNVEEVVVSGGAIKAKKVAKIRGAFEDVLASLRLPGTRSWVDNVLDIAEAAIETAFDVAILLVDVLPETALLIELTETV